MTFWQTVGRGLRLRCPRCGEGKVFTRFFTMPDACASCGMDFKREHGYYIGAMYINYGVTVVLALLGSFALEYWTQPSLTHQLVLWVGFCTVFPVLFFRHARGRETTTTHSSQPRIRLPRQRQDPAKLRTHL